MACVNPFVRIENLNKWETAKDGHKYHPAKVVGMEKYQQEVLDNPNTRFTGWTKAQIIPCGNCIECRLDKARDRANQGYLESLYSKDNYFITLTIDDDHLIIPEEIITSEGLTFTAQEDWNGHLIKRSVQLFMKRLKEHFRDKEDFHEPIRYMLCGEYGDQKDRPHYHIIIFNCPFPLESFYNPKQKKGNIYWQNKIIEDKWEYGFSDITDCTWNTINYVARYITKKMKGNYSEEYYASKGQTPEFTMGSNRPGLGYRYYEDHKDEIYKNDQILIKNKKGSHYVKPPRYFDELYKKENPKHFEEIRKKREFMGMNKQKEADMTTSKSRYEQNKVRERTVTQRTIALKRNNIEY